MASRQEVVQSMLNLFSEPSYLEIGVDSGDTFKSISAERKVAVDPAFKFRPEPSEPGNFITYHEKTSDAYFAQIGLRASMFDVVYIDGLHTFEQVLRDLLSSVQVLKTPGVIVIDDILPNSYHASLPDIDEAFAVRDYLATWRPGLELDNTWMGDVYKIAFFIRSFMQQFSYASVQENHGQLILWHKARPAGDMGRQTMAEIAALDFRQVILQREAFRFAPLSEILSQAGKVISRPEPLLAGQSFKEA